MRREEPEIEKMPKEQETKKNVGDQKKREKKEKNEDEEKEHVGMEEEINM
jgi:hypothetical protein